MQQIQNPRLKANLRFNPISPQELFVQDEEGGRHLLKGEVFVQLSKWLENRLSHQEIMDLGVTQFKPEEIYYALFQLQEMGYLDEEESTLLPSQWLAMLQSLSIAPPDALKKLKSCPIEVESLDASLPSVREFFEEYPFSWTGSRKLKILVTDHYRRNEVLEWSQKAREQGISWLLVKAGGLQGLVGPLFVPGNGPCYECLRATLVRNQADVVWAEEKLQMGQPLGGSSESIPFVRDTVLAKAAFEAFRWIVDPSSSKIIDTLVTVDLSDETKGHRVIGRSSCACSSYPKASTDWNLASSGLQSLDGGYRTVDPELTWEKYNHLISPITGFVHRVEQTFHSCGSFVYRAFHQPMKSFSEDLLKAGKYRNHSAGKGRTMSQAKTGALCEALERISGIYQGSEPRIHSSYAALGPQAIYPNEIDLFSQNQYATRATWNATCDPFNLVPRPLDPEELTDWTALWSLTQKQEKWLPTACCYFSYPVDPKKEPFAIGNSNGCAAGNTLEEAILQGLLEIIERDSTALWWYNQLQMAQVDLASFRNVFFDRAMQGMEREGRKLWVLDLMFDLTVPVFAAISTKNGKEFLLGLGAHLDAELAITRAMLELMQIKASSDKKEVVTAEQEKAVFLQPSSSIKTSMDYPKQDGKDIKQAILDLVRLLEGKNLEVFVLNQTRPEIGLPVVRTFVPGMRHFWKRFAPGRLYDIPHQLNIISRPLSEEELNPHPIIF